MWRLRLTERIWLRAFGTPPKSAFGGLQIRSERYVQFGFEENKKMVKVE
jgi:hypothetical protein